MKRDIWTEKPSTSHKKTECRKQIMMDSKNLWQWNGKVHVHTSSLFSKPLHFSLLCKRHGPISALNSSFPYMTMHLGRAHGNDGAARLHLNRCLMPQHVMMKGSADCQQQGIDEWSTSHLHMPWIWGLWNGWSVSCDNFWLAAVLSFAKNKEPNAVKREAQNCAQVVAKKGCTVCHLSGTVGEGRNCVTSDCLYACMCVGG